MKLQTAYNKMVKHLLTQKKKSKDKDTCLYRGPNGTMCAVGALIPKKYYNEDMETRGIYAVLHLFTDFKEYIMRHCDDEDQMESLLVGCQCIHDESHPNSWKKELLEIGKSFNLDISVCEEF